MINCFLILVLPINSICIFFFFSFSCWRDGCNLSLNFIWVNIDSFNAILGIRPGLLHLIGTWWWKVRCRERLLISFSKKFRGSMDTANTNGTNTSSISRGSFNGFNRLFFKLLVFLLSSSVFWVAISLAVLIHFIFRYVFRYKAI